MIDDFVMIAIDDDDYYIIMSKMMSKMDMCYNIINICCYYWVYWYILLTDALFSSKVKKLMTEIDNDLTKRISISVIAAEETIVCFWSKQMVSIKKQYPECMPRCSSVFLYLKFVQGRDPKDTEDRL